MVAMFYKIIVSRTFAPHNFNNYLFASIREFLLKEFPSKINPLIWA